MGGRQAGIVHMSRANAFESWTQANKDAYENLKAQCFWQWIGRMRTKILSTSIGETRV